MKFLHFLPCFLFLAAPLLADNKSALKEISVAFDQIEKDYKDWPHYSYQVENMEGGQSRKEDVWKSEGDSGFIRVESQNFDDHGELKTQFFFKGADLLFSLDRSESSPMELKAPTSVTERRYYFAGDKLIRVLEKKGTFPSGKPTNTAGLKNREVPPGELENADETYRTQHEIAAGIIENLRRAEAGSSGEAADAPAQSPEPAGKGASGTGNITGEGWRMIAGSASRDGRYALAWGLKGSTEIQGEAAEDGSLSVTEDEAKLVNYLVDLQNKSIVGPLKGKHFADKSSLGHSTSETAWSSAATFVAQINSGKWATWDAQVYEMKEGEKASLSKGTDLLEPVKKAIREFKAGDKAVKKLGFDNFTFALHDTHIAQRGPETVLVVEVNAGIPKSEEEGAFFDVTLTFSLAPDENGGAPALKSLGAEGH